MSNKKPSLVFRIFRAFTPPIIFIPIMHIFSKKPELFDGEENSVLFKKYLKKCRVYGEYGCGLSTQYVLDNTNCSIISVDSSDFWVNLVKSRSNNSKRLKIHYVDIGIVGEWGRPIDYKNRDNFKNYTDQLWEQTEKPDVVLIDGRFRVACFLTCLLKAPLGTVIIFDDYIDRPEYHIIEEFIGKKEYSGRQAIFIVEQLEDAEIIKINELLERFRFVMD